MRLITIRPPPPPPSIHFKYCPVLTNVSKHKFVSVVCGRFERHESVGTSEQAKRNIKEEKKNVRNLETRLNKELKIY
jgi:hypothetical protein